MSISSSTSISIFLFLTLIPATFSLTFDMYPITRSEGGSLNLTGDAYITDEGLQVTNNERDQNPGERVGRATYADELHLWDKASNKLADFSTYFTFVIDSHGNSSFGDGLAFFMAPEGSTIRNWSYGGGLGLGNLTTPADSSSLDTFVAVEFDTFPNDFVDPTYDGWPVIPHVGIDLNNLNSVTTASWYNNVSQEWQNDARISYNSITKIMSVEFTGYWDNQPTKGSLIWEVDLRDYLPEYVTVGFSAATGDLFEKHTVKSWNFSSTELSSSEGIPSPSPLPQVVSDGGNDLKLQKNNKNNNRRLVFGLSGGISLLILASAFTIVCFLLRKKKNRKELEKGHLSDSAMDNEFEMSNGPKKFSYSELVLATNDFAEEQKLGEGGFGGVYRGFLREANTHVAVKKVSEGSKQGRKEYAAEVKIISQLRHINLVELIGWCHQSAELLLVYELMPNGSLDSHLFKLSSVLTWEMRYKIAQGVASALLYLHEELRKYVVHRDIKASNIMLDNNFNAKLGDFGLARLVDHDKDMESTIPAGTIGYMAPEYFFTGKASKETDIYSFGIVLLEIACGRRPIDKNLPKNQVFLVEWVWNLHGAGQLIHAADAKLDSSEYDVSKIERLMVVGLWCVQPESSLRPSIRQVMQVLNSEDPLPDVPLEMPKAVYFSPQVVHVSSSSTRSGGSTQIDSGMYGQGSSSSTNMTTSSAGSMPDLLPK